LAVFQSGFAVLLFGILVFWYLYFGILVFFTNRRSVIRASRFVGLFLVFRRLFIAAVCSLAV